MTTIWRRCEYLNNMAPEIIVAATSPRVWYGTIELVGFRCDRCGATCQSVYQKGAGPSLCSTCREKGS